MQPNCNQPCIMQGRRCSLKNCTEAEFAEYYQFCKKPRGISDRKCELVRSTVQLTDRGRSWVHVRQSESIRRRSLFGGSGKKILKRSGLCMVDSLRYFIKIRKHDLRYANKQLGTSDEQYGNEQGMEYGTYTGIPSNKARAC